MFLLLTARLAAAACEAPTTADQLQATVGDALATYGALDEDGFLTLAKQAEAELGCLSGPLTPAGAAAYERVDGLRRFVSGDATGAGAAFRAAHALDGRYHFPEAIAPAGGKLAQAYDAASHADPSRAERLRIDDGLQMWIDGTETTVRPKEIPAIVQIANEGGAVRWTKVLAPGEEFVAPSLSGAVVADAPADTPDAPPADTADAPPVATPEKSGHDLAKPDEPSHAKHTASTLPAAAHAEKPHGKATPWWVATATSAVVAGGLFGGAVYSNMEFTAHPHDHDAWVLNHATYYGSLGMAGVTVVFGAIAIGGSF